MRPILLGGPAGAGKDTAARELSQTFGLTMHRLTAPVTDTLSTAAWQRTIGRMTQRGVDPAMAVRRAKQIVGDAYRALDPTALVDDLVGEAADHFPAVVVPDLRLPDEWARFRVLWPESLLIYCDAPRDIRAARLEERDGVVLTWAAAEHHTEQDVERLRELADWVWANHGSFNETQSALKEWVARSRPS